MTKEPVKKGIPVTMMTIVSGSRKNVCPMMSIALRSCRGSRLFTMSMRMCSLSRSVHDAQSRNTKLNSTHCSSSQAFEDISNVLRTTALIAEMTTASRIAHAHHLPICTLMASMTLLSLRSARTPNSPLPPAARRAHRPRGGTRQGALTAPRRPHLSREKALKVKPPCARKPRLCARNWSGRRESNPRHTAWEARASAAKSKTCSQNRTCSTRIASNSYGAVAKHDCPSQTQTISFKRSQR
jgi:hypothetical protein